MHMASLLHCTCMNFLIRFISIQFFDEVEEGNMAVFESSNISETGKMTATKIGVHACDINPYLHEFFEPILLN